MEKRKVLGRGLETLLPSRQAPAAHPRPLAHRRERFINWRRADRPQSLPDPHPCGRTGLAGAGGFYQGSGVLQPITVRAIPGGRFQLIAGERRWLASQRAGKTTVPAIVRQVSNEQAMEMTIIENLQREDLNPIEQARAFERLGRGIRADPGANCAAHRQRALLGGQLPAPAAAAGAGASSGGDQPDQLRPCQGADGPGFAGKMSIWPSVWWRSRFRFGRPRMRSPS